MDTRALVYHPMRVRHLYGRAEYAAAGHRRLAMRDEWQVEHPGRGILMAICELLDLDGAFDDLSEGERAAIEESGPSVEMAAEELIRSGLNIFDLSRLAPAFRDTSVDEVEPWLLKMPFPVFYLHFGEAAAIPSPFPGVVVDGAYICRAQDDPVDGFAVQIELVCSYPGPFSDSVSGIESTRAGRAGAGRPADRRRPTSELIAQGGADGADRAHQAQGLDF